MFKYVNSDLLRNYLAKPTLDKNGREITLYLHKMHLLIILEYFKEDYPVIFNLYKKRTGYDLYEDLRLCVEMHDLGKADENWQNACRKDYKNYLSLSLSERKNFKGENLQNSGVRHEQQSGCPHFYSDFLTDKHLKIRLSQLWSVLGHHGFLDMYHINRWIEDQNFSSKKYRYSKSSINQFNEAKKYGEKFFNDNSAKEGGWKALYENDLLRSLIQFIDRSASAFEKGVPFKVKTRSSNYELSFPKLRPFQNEIKKAAHNFRIVGRSYCGQGKTGAAMLFAKHHLEQGNCEKVVLLMPTRYTTEQLALSINRDIIGEKFEAHAYHGGIVIKKLTEKKDISEEEKLIIKSRFKSVKSLEEDVTVMTIDNIIYAMCRHDERSRYIMTQLQNSCVIIDEIDFYETWSLAPLCLFFQMLRENNVPLMIMSATIPDKMIDLFTTKGKLEDLLLVDDNSVDHKNKFEIKEIQSVNRKLVYQGYADKIELLRNKPAIIYVNTVNRGIEVYEVLKSALPDRKIVLYHSNFFLEDRAKKEDEIIFMLGKNAWDNRTADGIVIMTQVGELSLNISAPIMITEVAPLDRLAQRFGRCSRFNLDEIGEIYIQVVRDDKGEYFMPYGEYNDKEKKWTPQKAFVETVKVLEEVGPKVLKIGDIRSLVNRVYSDSITFNNASEKNLRNFTSLIAKNFILNSGKLNDDEESNDSEFSFRKIPAQKLIWKNRPSKEEYENFDDFKIDLSRYTISVYQKQFEELEKDKFVSKIFTRIKIGEEKFKEVEVNFLTDSNFYSYEKGLHLRRK